MSTPYSNEYSPPLPVLPVKFGAPETRPLAGPFMAIVDTGADISVAPKSVLLAVQAPSIFEAQLRSPWGEVHSLVVYLVDLLVNDHLLAGVQIAGDDTGDELILGRNALNKLALLLDGPQQQCDIPTDSIVQRLRAGRVIS